MSIPFVCGDCGTRMIGPDDTAGQQLDCPHCGRPVLVPGPCKSAPYPALPITVTSGAPAPASRFGKTLRSPAAHLPADLGVRLRGELTSGEALIWAGQPSIGYHWMGGIGMMVIGLLLATIPTVIMSGIIAANRAANGGVPSSFGAIPLVGILFGLLILVLAPIHVRIAATLTAYAVTNRRVIILNRGWWGGATVQSYTPLQLQDMRREDFWWNSGLGNVLFVDRLEARYLGDGGRSSVHIREGFFWVARARDVEKLIRSTLVNPVTDRLLQ